MLQLVCVDGGKERTCDNVSTYPYFVLICVKNYLLCRCGNFPKQNEIEPLGLSILFYDPFPCPGKRYKWKMENFAASFYASG